MKGAKSVPAPEAEHIRTAQQTVLPRLVHSPALWLFMAVSLLALIIYIPIGGNGYGLLVLLTYMLYYALVSILVVRLTRGVPPAAWEEAAEAPRARLWVQLVVIAFFLTLFVALTVAIFSPGSLPGLGPFLEQRGEGLAVLLAFVGIPIVCLLPLVILRLLGVGFREMGLGRGYHAFRVAAVGCSVPACFLVIFLALGHVTPLALGKEMIQVALFTAIPEEVLFRGVLMTRLIRLLGLQWGILLAVGIFALMHVETDLSQYGSLPLALVVMMLTQAVVGLLLAIVFVRTRSVLSGVLLHTLLDTFGYFARF